MRRLGGKLVKYDGAIVEVRVGTVVQADGSRAEREAVAHAGSVAIVALNAEEQVLLIRPFCHPAGHRRDYYVD